MGRNKRSLASCLILLVLIGLTAGLSSCGGGGGSRPVTKPGDEVIITPPENGAPIILQALEDITPPPTSGAFRWESEALTEYFSDPDGDTLQFSAQTDNADVSSVEVSETGVLIVHVSEPATAGISVTATDPQGATATQQFTVSVTGTEDTDGPPPADHSDTQAGAVPITPGQTVRGEFHSADDVDWLRLELPEPGLVQFQFDAPTGAEITVFDRNGHVLANGRTQSGITITVPADGVSLIKVLRPVAIAKAVSWTLRAVAGAYIAPLIPSITVKAGLAAEIGKNEILCGVSLTEYSSEAGYTVENCEVLVTGFEEDLNIGSELYIGSTQAATVSIRNSALSIDTLCSAPRGKTTAIATVRVAGFRVSVRVEDTKTSDFELLESFAFRTPIDIYIDQADEAKCRPERIPDGPELSASVRAGDSVSLTLTDYIQDPRDGELSFSASEEPEDIRATVDGRVLTITAEQDAEDDETTIKIRANSTKPDDLPGYNYENEFTLLVSVVSGGCWARAWYGNNFLIVQGEINFPGFYLDFYTDFPTDHANSFGYTVEYTGECSGGLANGNGKLTAIGPLNESFSYNGEWTNGVPRGNGALHMSHPDWGVLHYEGGLRNGRYYGQGTLTAEFNDGYSLSYTGTWNVSETLGSNPNRGTLTQTADGVETREVGEFRNFEPGRQLVWNGTWTVTPSSGSGCSRVVEGEILGPC